MNNERPSARFRTRQRGASNILRCEKRKYIQNIMASAELGYKTHKTRDMYEYMRVNNLKSGYIKKERFLRNGNGSLITTSKELTKKCGKYFNGLLNCEEPEEVLKFNLETRDDQDCTEPTLEEIRSQINNLKK